MAYIMSANDFIAKAKDIAQNYNTVYMWAVFGAPVTESIIATKTRQYPSWYTASKQASFRKLIGKDYFGFDCVNLIKAILWGWKGDRSKTWGGATYASNGVPDTNANGMITKCLNVSASNWASITPGEVVWMSGHIGIYIGDGLAVECTPKWKNRVQITAVGNIGPKAGYNTRTWTKHGKLPWINYAGAAASAPSAPSTLEFKVGDPIEVPDEVPSKPSDTKYDYEFERWIGYYPGMLAETPVTFESDFREVLRTYTIVFKSEGEVLSEMDMQYGDTIVPPNDPVRDSDERFDYEFSGCYGYLRSGRIFVETDVVVPVILARGLGYGGKPFPPDCLASF